MTTETILTGDEISKTLVDAGILLVPQEITGYDIVIARAIEQAVLQSPEIKELRKDALFGRIAMRFVDRAGDYCKEDPAEKICDEFNAAIHAAMEQQK